MAARAIEVNIVGLPRGPKWRPRFMVRAGVRLLPESVTEAWYEQKCPRRLDVRAAGIGCATWLVWRFSCWLRGCRKES